MMTIMGITSQAMWLKMVKSIVILLETVTNEDLAVYSDGSFKTFKESDTTAQKLVDSGVVNTFAFGPTLVENGKVAVSENEEVGQDMADNPRTAIVVNEESDRSVHYIVIVSDGRTSESSGLTLYEMAELMKSYGVTTAYNLDGGGSSTMYFNGQVINKPTHKRKQNLRKGGERYRLHRLLKNQPASTFSPTLV